MMRMSPRLASINSGADPNVVHNGSTDDHLMNSSCKDTMKMHDRREFSFFESVNKEFGNANVGAYNVHQSLAQSRQGNQLESINVG